MDDERYRDLDAYVPPRASASRREVMLDAVEQLAELHRATLRLGDALVAGGLPGPEWRSRDAELSLLDDALPDNTLDEFVTRVTAFAVDSGPTWLHGDAFDLDAFQEEVVILGDVVYPLRRVAQRVRVLPPHQRGDLPLERAFGHALVAMPLDRVASILRDLEHLAPLLAPLSPEEWDAPPAPARDRLEREPEPERDAWQPAHSAMAEPSLSLAPAASRTHTRLRDFIPVGSAYAAGRAAAARSGEPSTRELFALLLRRIARAVRHLTQPQRWALTLGVAAVLGLIVLLVHLAFTQSPARPSLLIASPAKVTLACSTHAVATTVTLKNPGNLTITWQIPASAPLAIAPANGTLAAGQSVTLRISAASPTAQSGTLLAHASDGVLALPYSITCS